MTSLKSWPKLPSKVAKDTYVYGLGLISMTNNAGTQRYVFPDGLGSTISTVNASNQEVATDYEYDVFGGLRSGFVPPPAPVDRDTFLFAGQQYDPLARGNAGGLYYMRARYYDPTTGTFLTRDPLGLQLAPSRTSPGGMPAVMNPSAPTVDGVAARGGGPNAVADPEVLNPYAYVSNDPANDLDPSGTCSVGSWSFCGIGFDSIDLRPLADGGSPTLLSAVTNNVHCHYADCQRLNDIEGTEWSCVAGPFNTLVTHDGLVCTLTSGGNPSFVLAAAEALTSSCAVAIWGTVTNLALAIYLLQSIDKITPPVLKRTSPVNIIVAGLAGYVAAKNAADIPQRCALG